MKKSPIREIVVETVLAIDTYRLKLVDLSIDIQIGNFIHQAVRRILDTDPRYKDGEFHVHDPVAFLYWMKDVNKALALLTVLAAARDLADFDRQMHWIKKSMRIGGVS